MTRLFADKKQIILSKMPFFDKMTYFLITMLSKMPFFDNKNGGFL